MSLIVVDSFSKCQFHLYKKYLPLRGYHKSLLATMELYSRQWSSSSSVSSILLSAPFRPASNGLAERSVRTFKEVFSKSIKENVNKELALWRYLVNYRSTLYPVSGKSRAEILHGRQNRSLLSPHRPESHPRTHFKAKFIVGQSVQARNFSGNDRWISGRIMYAITIKHGTIRRHQNHIWKAITQPDIETTRNDADWDLVPGSPQVITQSQKNSDHLDSAPNEVSSLTFVENRKPILCTPTIRRSDRPRKQTVRFQVLPQ